MKGGKYLVEMSIVLSSFVGMIRTAIMKLFSHSVLLLILALFVRNARTGSAQTPLRDYSCEHPSYTIHLFSKAPLVIYISNFVTPEERAHLQEIT